MQVTVEAKDELLILKVSGRMIFGEPLYELRTHVQKALAAGIRRFVLDISDVSYLDSSACGELISIHTSIVKAQGLLAIVNPQERVRTLLVRIKLTQILNIVATVEQARNQ
jgi:anti-sigma B factor antagonist